MTSSPFPIGGGEGSPYPFGINDQPGPSPIQQREVDLKQEPQVAERLAKAKNIAPSARQQTQSEVLNLALLMNEIGSNPFSTRVISFQILRDMATDPTINFARWFLVNPLVKTERYVECEDAALAAAVDKAFRPMLFRLILGFSASLMYGYAPGVQNWRMGPLEAKYRDRHSDDPEKERDVWKSPNIAALMPDVPTVLAPENCIPKWDESGYFDGFMYSPVPIPNPMMLGIAETYGPSVMAGYPIEADRSIWYVNEQMESFGSIYGCPRQKRAYRMWWSKWFRWALFDRAFENTAEPTKVIYYPTEVPEGFDPNDPNPQTPQSFSLEQKAIQTGRAMRSGAVIALPGDFMDSNEGRTLPVRKWEAKYLEVQRNFTELSEGFTDLEVQILRAMLLPEQAFLDSNVTGQGSSQRYVATQMGEIYQESEELVNLEFDEYINKYFLPTFIAYNFPDKLNTPCAWRSGTLGGQNDELVKQIVTVIGQKDPSSLGIDVKKLLQQQGLPMASQQQQDAMMEKEAKVSAAKGPPVMPPAPKKAGSQGYNAGVERTETGETIYVRGPQVIHLSGDHEDFIKSLPDIPPYRAPSSRTALLALRKLFMSHYQAEVKGLAKAVREKGFVRIPLGLPDESEGMGESLAKLAAQSFAATWLGKQLVDGVTFPAAMATHMAKIALNAAAFELKRAHLDDDVVNQERIKEWAQKYAEECAQSIQNTIRDECATFLTEELQHKIDPKVIAHNLEEHFAETPMTHTERALRSQVREAYNRGMLFAAQDAGIDQVLAHDASDGTDRSTDNPCILRNGKTFSPEEAMQQYEHPNGTLYFTYLSTSNLRSVITNDIPEGLELDDDSPGVYDPGTEVFYLRPEFADEEAKWMLILGEALKL